MATPASGFGPANKRTTVLDRPIFSPHPNPSHRLKLVVTPRTLYPLALIVLLRPIECDPGSFEFPLVRPIQQSELFQVGNQSHGQTLQ